MPLDEQGLHPSISEAEPAQTDTRQKIVDAAGDVFSKNGYARATTRSIAKAAGVSEVTLFRCFESKENLFQAVMEAYGSPYLVRVMESRLTGDYQQDMRMMGDFFMRALLDRANSVVFLLSEANHFPKIRPMFSKVPRQLWQMLARYLQKKMDDGTVRELHPESAAQSFFGAIFVYCIGSKILGVELKPELSEQEAAAQIVDIFIKGTIAEQSADGRRGKP